jgi:chromosome segregation ATPase
MKPKSIRETVQKIDGRLERVEQVLPTLATGETVQKIDARLERVEQILPTLATKAQLQEATDQTARAMKAVGEETRRHMDVVSEATRYEVQLLAEGQQALGERIDRSIEEIKGVLRNHEGRLTRLESERPS